jgi:hypothetical protein
MDKISSLLLRVKSLPSKLVTGMEELSGQHGRHLCRSKNQKKFVRCSLPPLNIRVSEL